MSLGGNFSSLEQIKSCYMISEKKFNEMKPYIVLTSVASKPKPVVQDNSSIQLIDAEKNPTVSVRLKSLKNESNLCFQK